MNSVIKKIRMHREGKLVWDAKMSEPLKAILLYDASSPEAKAYKPLFTVDEIKNAINL